MSLAQGIRISCANYLPIGVESISANLARHQGRKWTEASCETDSRRFAMNFQSGRFFYRAQCKYHRPGQAGPGPGSVDV